MSNNIQFSKVQLDYIKRVHASSYSSIDPSTTVQTIMYDAGVRNVIATIEKSTIGAVPTSPR